MKVNFPFPPFFDYSNGMLLLELVWALATVLEGMLYADRPVLRLNGRLWLLRGMLIVSSVLTIWLIFLDWRLWLVAGILQAYRIVNVLRFLRLRLPLPRLNSVALRAHVWLAIIQGISVSAVWLAIGNISFGTCLVVISIIQLVCALLLLRSSVQTWQYSRPNVVGTNYTDRELPSLSVLVPARNENLDLQICLERLIESDYPKLEILVLDDDSTNRRTPEIIRGFAHAGVRFIQGAESDETHWLAKNRAYERLRQEASGELLLFCGVDALFEPQTIRELVQLMLQGDTQMLSVLPLRSQTFRPSISLLQPMRYYWELCLPRRFFKRPPVLSTCWLIRSDFLEHAGGFGAVTHSIAPEAYFARQAVVTDSYLFLRSDETLGLRSSKPTSEQYATSVRMRYPQLHRRLELVAITSFAILIVLLGPLIGLCFAPLVAHAMAYVTVWLVCIGCLLATYYIAAVTTGLNPAWSAWLLMPIAFACDIVIQHISLYKYEFSRVEWKGRDIVQPVMQVIPRLPKI